VAILYGERGESKNMSVVYTVGYEGTDIDRFVATLKAVGITALVDVRAIAVSRKKGFSKNGLRERLQAEGIAYLHLVELGDPKPGREAARAGKYAEFRRVYSAHLDSTDAVGALKLLDQSARQETVSLLCFERDPATCHRTMIGDRLKARGHEIFNLFADEPSRYVRHAKKLPRSRPRQSNSESQPKIW
jgi:uncharacterized protein (DUF488 family)